MMLSKPAILRHMEAGNLVICPFVAKNVNTTSVDVRLGRWFFRERQREGGLGTFNPYDEASVLQVWGKAHEAESLRAWLDRQDSQVQSLRGISPDDRIIMIGPAETILGHTEEFIGGRRLLTTDMKARSSMGRSFIAVCKCAGAGDVGFFNRWTMEITNFSRDRDIPLVVGRRIAQIRFFEVEPLEEDYADSGKYQSSADLDSLKANWHPEMMLPRLWRDRELELVG